MPRQLRKDFAAKLGDYLLEEDIHATDSLHNALKKQTELKKNGVFKPLGVIFREENGPSPQLERALQRMHHDVLAASPLFQDLPDESLTNTLLNAEQRIVAKNTILFHKGEKLDSFFFIISGKVKAYLLDDEGHEVTMATLQSGEGFGESILCDEEYSGVSMKTLEPTSLFLFSKQYFNRLKDVYPQLSIALLKCLTNKLRLGYENLAGASENEHDLLGFISRRDTPCLPDLLGQTPRINKLRKSILKAAVHSHPLLITGEPGTEKSALALMLHNHGPNQNGTFLSMNAEEVFLEGYGGAILDSTEIFRLEMAQCSELFGRCPGTMPTAKSKRLGLLSIATNGTVFIEHIEKLTLGTGKALFSYLTTNQFIQMGGTKSIDSQCNIVASTNTSDLNLLAEQGLFHSGLAALLQENKYTIPPLRKRKGDLLLLVDFFIIKECFKGTQRKIIQGISPASYRRIMEYDWPGNMEELEIVIRRAVNLAKHDHLMPEDIFLGMAPPKGKYTFNLLQIPLLLSFFTHPYYPTAFQILTGIFFSSIILAGFLGNPSPEQNISVYLVWALWWPLLTISWFFGARIWCSLCPMGALNDLSSRFFTLGKKAPTFIRDKGVYLSAGGLLLITLGETASSMPSSPFATSILLLTISLAVAISALLFHGRVWCRYLCPLGKLAGIFSGCSLIEWRSNGSICNSTCTDHSCYKGRDGIKGCPMLQGPFTLSSNQDCILCGNCLKSCENNSPTLNLRMPGHELWAAIKPNGIIGIIVPVIMGTQLFRSSEHLVRNLLPPGELGLVWLSFAALIISTTIGSFIFIQIAGAITFPDIKNTAFKTAHLFSHGIIPLLFVYELAFQLSPLLERLGHILPVLGRQMGIDLEILNFGLSRAGVVPLQELCLLAGTLTSIVFIALLARKHCIREGHPKIFRHLPVIGLGLMYMWIFG